LFGLKFCLGSAGDTGFTIPATWMAYRLHRPLKLIQCNATGSVPSLATDHTARPRTWLGETTPKLADLIEAARRGTARHLGSFSERPLPSGVGIVWERYWSRSVCQLS
jgi:hypothetical protein